MTLLTPEYLENGSYGSKKDRYVFQTGASLQEGVYGVTDFLVSQRAAGTDRSVDIAAGAAWVQGDSTTRQGIYHIVNDAPINAPLNTADGTNPRLDQIVVQINDITDGNGLTNTPTISVLTGTPSVGATLNNRTGAAAVPASALVIADVLVGAGVTAITNTAIRDRRPWARGAFWSTIRTANAAAGNDYTNSSNAAYALVDGTNLQPRIECTGAPLLISTAIQGTVSVVSQAVYVGLMVDGVAVNSPATQFTVSNANFDGDLSFSQVITPTPGSHLIGLAYRPSGGASTATLRAQAAAPLSMSVQEILRPSIANNPAGYG